MGTFQGYYFDTKAREYYTVTFHNGLYYLGNMDSDERLTFDSLPVSFVKVHWDINGDLRRAGQWTTTQSRT